MVCWVVGLMRYVGPTELFLVPAMLHDWCKKKKVVVCAPLTVELIGMDI